MEWKAGKREREREDKQCSEDCVVSAAGFFWCV